MDLVPEESEVLKISVRSFSVNEKPYAYHVRLCVGIIGAARPLYLPLSLRNDRSTAAPPPTASTTTSQPYHQQPLPPSVAPSFPWWNATTNEIVIPTNTKATWVLDEGQSVDYIEVPKLQSHGETKPPASDVTVLFQLQKVKVRDGSDAKKQYATQMYPEKVTLQASSKTVNANFSFGETAAVGITIQRLEIAEIVELRRDHGESSSIMVANRTATRGITTLADTLALLSTTAASTLEGSRVHKFLEDWSGALHGVGTQLAPLVEALPFGDVLVKTVAGLFSAIVSYGGVLEVGADVCSQIALMLRVLAQPSVRKMIIADPSSFSFLEKLVALMEDTARVLQEHQADGRVRQLWSSSRRLKVLDSNSSEIRAIFTMLYQLTSFRVMAEHSANASAITEGVSVVRATSLLTAADLCTHLLPQLVALLNKNTTGASSHTNMNLALDELRQELRNDLNEVTSNMFCDINTVVAATGDRSVTLITEAINAVTESSATTTISTMSATMCSLINESMTNVLPQIVKRATDESFLTNLGVLQTSLNDVVAAAWTSALQLELHTAVERIQAHTKETVQGAEVRIRDGFEATLQARLDNVVSSARNAMNSLYASMESALDTQTKEMVDVVREGALSVRSLVHESSLSSLERIAVLHMCVTDVAIELNLQKEILKKDERIA